KETADALREARIRRDQDGRRDRLLPERLRYRAVLRRAGRAARSGGRASRGLMLLRVLGSSAGGGLPQWNCACPNCTDARSGSGRVRPRTQDGLAIGAGASSWFLINASPDI